MGFWEGLGDFLGSMAGNLAAQGQAAQQYKKEYEYMSDSDLMDEREHLKKKSGKEYKLRLMAVNSILADRGYR